MRRNDREVATPDVMWRMIREGLVMHLALLDPNDKLYATCVHYGFIREKNLIYFHGAMKGRKAETLAVHPEAAFQIISRTEMVSRPGNPGYFLGIYRSVMGNGRVRIVTDLEEKRSAIRCLHEHYGDRADDYEVSDIKLEKIVNVFALEIAEMTGKIKGYPNPDHPDAKNVIKDWQADNENFKGGC
ncbi:MAG: pyridoxamine 5'-phosphate oxidase family protein [Fretibacterium sp.]|nr:pyridoxamine 5'-phosphate oxidase family protein [Fretibacterium sp.]